MIMNTHRIIQGPRGEAVDASTIKYALFDIDNTLVSNESQDVPSDRFCRAARSLQERGISVGLATARPLQKVRHILDVIDAKGICIFSNGAQIYDLVTDTMHEEMIVDHGATEAILAELRKNSVMHWVQDSGEDYFWVGNSEEARARHDRLDGYEKSSDPWSMPSAKTAITVDEYLPNKPFVIVARHVARPVVATLEALGRDYVDRSVAVLTAHETVNSEGNPVYDVFFVHTHGNKKDALPKACQFAGVAVRQAMMTGDGLNDVVILEQTGIAVAVANAHPDAKAAATHLAPRWDEDGAAIAIEELLLTNE